MNNVRIRSVSIPMTIAKIAICEIENGEKGQNHSTIVGFHMTSLKLKLKNYPSYRDFTFTMH